MAPKKKAGGWKEPSMRETFLEREQARQWLHAFISLIYSWPGRNEHQHFFSGPEAEIKTFADLSEEEQEEILARQNAKPADSIRIVSRPMTRSEERRHRQIESKARRELSADRCARYLGAFFRILEQAAMYGNPTRKDLDVLLDALNQPKHSLDWENNMASSFSAASRDVAESLLEYLRLSARCGPVHAACGDCGAMFVRSRGDRKFCHDCSKKHQTYQYRKEYLLGKKREYYRREKGERQEIDRDSRNKGGRN